MHGSGSQRDRRDIDRPALVGGSSARPAKEVMGLGGAVGAGPGGPVTRQKPISCEVAPCSSADLEALGAGRAVHVDLEPYRVVGL